jgi:DNA-binding transcriptional LysR family regulator
MSFLNLDLNLLRVFDAVMVEQNLTRAAQRLAMSQPAVSNAIKRLRSAMHNELLIRTAHGVRPTARAEELWPTVRDALTALEAIVAPGGADIAESQATLRLAMMDATASLMLPSLMRLIARHAPKMTIRMSQLRSRDPRVSLMQREIDLAIGFFPGVVAQLKGEHGVNSPIRHSRLYTGEYVCVMRKEHPLAHGELTLDRYCAAEHVLVSASGRAHGLVEEVLEKLGRKRRLALTVNQFFTAGRVVAGSDLVTVIPRHLIAATGMEHAVVARELPFQLPAVHVDMLWHARATRSADLAWLREQVTAVTRTDIGGIGFPDDLRS